MSSTRQSIKEERSWAEIMYFLYCPHDTEIEACQTREFLSKLVTPIVVLGIQRTINESTINEQCSHKLTQERALSWCCRSPNDVIPIGLPTLLFVTTLSKRELKFKTQSYQECPNAQTDRPTKFVDQFVGADKPTNFLNKLFDSM